jgi:hypothetical protein
MVRVNGRRSRGEHTAEASRVLPIKRGEKPCPSDHDTQAMRDGAACPNCGAAK